MKGENISIHALREEGDGDAGITCALSVKFLSTPSARRATAEQVERYTAGLFLSTPSARRATSNGLPADFANLISIHALREEGDFLCFGVRIAFIVISIHALREEGDKPS